MLVFDVVTLDWHCFISWLVYHVIVMCVSSCCMHNHISSCVCVWWTNFSIATCVVHHKNTLVVWLHSSWVRCWSSKLIHDIHCHSFVYVILWSQICEHDYLVVRSWHSQTILQSLARYVCSNGYSNSTDRRINEVLLGVFVELCLDLKMKSDVGKCWHCNLVNCA